MDNLSQQLKRFSRRVRLVRAWRGLAMGLLIGGGLGIVWSALDWFGLFYTEWLWLGVLVSASALIGALIGFVLPVADRALANSIDRRAALKDRLVTAREEVGENAFSHSLQVDAQSHLNEVTPSTVFPMKVGKWQAGAVAMCSVAAAIFLLGNTPLLLNDSQRKQAEELKRQGAKVERIVRESLDDPKISKDLTDEERRLADELLKLKRELEKNRLSKEQALQKANEIANKADELMRQRVKNSLSSLKTADTAMDKLRKEAMDKVGMKQNADPSMMKMSDQQREAAMSDMQQQQSQMQSEMTSLQSQMSQLQKKLQDPNLSEAEKKALQQKLEELKKSMSELQKEMQKNKDAMDALKLSKEAQAVFEKMMNDPLYKQLQELAQKMAENASATAQDGQPKFTKEQMEKMQRQLEELAKKLKDDKAMKEYLQALLDAMKQGKQMSAQAGIGPGLLSLMHLQIPGAGSPSRDIWAGDSGVINKLDKGEAGRGKTSATMATGQRREGKGQETYIEIKAPTMVGSRTSVPYTQVLPSYKKKAESALDRKEIPKEHQKRVKEYFESLTGGK